MQHSFNLQKKDNYVSGQEMKTGEIGVTQTGILHMKLYTGEFVLLAGPTGTSGDIYGSSANIKVRILEKGSVVCLTLS